MAPINKITRTAHHISTNGDLSARLNLATTDDEVGRLANTFDIMLARLDDAFQRERRFTADASHELRTPLTTMRTILGTMLSQKRSTVEYEEALADLAEETDRMRDLTQGLLSLARNDDASTPKTDETVDLSKLLHDISEPFEELANEKGLSLTRYIPENLALTGDGDALVGLFSNLLANAIKYTPQGKINLSARSTDKGIEVTVADTGIGIAPDDTPHIFERFYRVDKSRSTPGTGLGLAIAHDAVLAHRGRLSVESELGQGTTFNVWLPFS
ncbi:MAG: ATP-binding protein [Anaerolineae bacterium]|nr:ATP-binding protein [Anaerolineae bacterium]